MITLVFSKPQDPTPKDPTLQTSVLNFVGEVTREAENLTTEDLILRNPNPDEEHLTVETVDPGSLEEQTVLNMIASVDAVMTTQEAENKGR